MADDDGIVAAAEIFKVLGAASRLRLVTLLASAPTGVGALVEATGLSQPLVSQHLRVLRQAGIVAVERTGREAVYRLADHHVAHVVDDAVAHALETEPHERRDTP